MRIKIGKVVISISTSECAREECSYFTHYLRHGPPTLSHAAFHKAEEECLKWQACAQEYWERDENEPDDIL